MFIETPVEPKNNDVVESIGYQEQTIQEATVTINQEIVEPIRKMRLGDKEYEYYLRNRSVSTVVNSYNSKTKEASIKTYSYDDISAENRIRNQFAFGFKLVYLIEVIIIFFIYIRKHKRLNL